jgi:hypothetical protein
MFTATKGLPDSTAYEAEKESSQIHVRQQAYLGYAFRQDVDVLTDEQHS